MQTAPVRTQYQRVYRIRMYSEPIYRVWLFVLFPALDLFNLIRYAWNHDTVWLAFYAILLMLALAFPWAYAQVYLLVGPDGITYSLLGGTLHASWDAVERIEEKRHWYGNTVRLVVREQWQRERWAWWLRWQKPYTPMRTASELYWQHGVFEDVYQHAPWLFADAPPR